MNIFKEKFKKLIPVENDKNNINDAIFDINNIEEIIEVESEDFNFPVSYINCYDDYLALISTGRFVYNPNTEYWIKVWENYKNAIGRRRAGSELPLDRFLNYIVIKEVYYFQFNDSYIFGQLTDNIIFTPTHFAPEGLRDGLEMIKEMKKYDNVAFAVTEDLKKMLKKLGYSTLPFLTKTLEFRGQDVKKYILFSDNVFRFFFNKLHDKFQSYFQKDEEEIVLKKRRK